MKVLHVFTLATTAENFFDGQFAYLSEVGYNLHLVASTEANKEFCQRNHLTFDKIEIARRVDIKADIKSIKSLCELIRNERFDAVFGHTPKGALVAMCAAWLSGVKARIYYRHGLIYTTAKGFRYRIFKAVEQFTSSLATNIINVSPSLSKLAIKDKLNGDCKQTVIGLGTCGGIDTENVFNPSLLSSESLVELKDSILGNCNFVVGFCGRLCRDKGVIELIEGFKLFQSRHPNLNPKLLLVGSYDERDVLPDNIKSEISDNPNIITTGRQEKSKLPALYALMDVFVFPSYREGFGMCVIEASAMQVPILVSRSHGCVDSIIDSITGHYIDITAESIAEGLDNMLDREFRLRLGIAGREFVINNFNRESMWPMIRKVYEDMIFN